MKIESNKEIVHYSSKKIFDFVGDFTNFEALLPKEKIENFTCTSESCSFRIKGMVDLGLEIKEKDDPSRIRMKSTGDKPFPFYMDIIIQSIDENSSEVHIDFEGEINPFMKMMVEKPLTNFFNILMARLSELKLD